MSHSLSPVQERFVADPSSPPTSDAVAAEWDRYRASRLGLGSLLLVTATLHFAVPGLFERLVPGWLGNARRWVYVSGGWEAISAILLLNRRTSRAGGYAAAATIVAVYPGNIKMALDAGAPSNPAAVLAWARLPLQVPLFAWAWKQAK